MLGSIRDVRRFINLCWECFNERGWGIPVVVVWLLWLVWSIYSFMAAVTPVLDLTWLNWFGVRLAALPKLPLPWIVTVPLVVLLTVLLVGGAELTRPKLEIVFDRTKEPFVRNERQITGHVARYFRVGVRTKGISVVRNCRLVLEELSPPLKGELGVHLGHGFEVMGITPPEEKFDVLPSNGEPYRYIDIACEDLNDRTVYLTYAAQVDKHILRPSSGTDRMLHLKLTGEGSLPMARSFVLKEDPATEELVFDEVPNSRA